MPRPERALDPGEGVLYEFAAGLRRVRERAGSPTYRLLSRRAHYSAAALSEAAGGRKLPSLAVTLAYVGACGADTKAWETRWRTTAAAVATPTDRAGAEHRVEQPAPYVGLRAFQPGDAERFFGREDLVADLLARIRAHRFVGVFGTSGSGKSSILLAGVAAVAMTDGLLGRGPQPTLVLNPGAHPMQECAVHLAELTGSSTTAVAAELARDADTLYLWVRQAMAGRPADEDLILIVDQFEETFTLCQDTAERSWFITALVRAATAPASRVRVAIGVRADFYGHCGQWPELVDALRDAQVLVGVMSAEQLRQAITQPAVHAGYTIETALISRLVADAAAQPAALPLMSHALLEIWRHRRGMTLTLASYEAAGGMDHSLTRTAESLYTELDPRQRDMARQILLRLIAIGNNTEATKRRVRRSELHEHDPNTGVVLETLARARLITLDRDTVDLAHEALIRCWPRLRGWLEDDRDGLRHHRQLTDATDTWEALDHDTGALYRGTRLNITREWAARNEELLTPREQRFLHASVVAQQEERRAAHRLRQLLAIVAAALLIVSTTTIVLAVRAQRENSQQRTNAVAEHAIAEADALFDDNPGLANQVLLAAYHLNPTPHAQNRVLASVLHRYDSRLVDHSDEVLAAAFSPDGHTLATGSADRTARLWDITNPYHPEPSATLTGHTASVRSVAISADGNVLATGAYDSTVRLWDITDRGHPVMLTTITAHGNMIRSVAFAPTGHLLATTSFDHTLRLWDTSTPAQPVELANATNGTDSYYAVAFSSDGHLLAAASSDHTTRLWTIDNGRLNPTATLTGHTDIVDAVTFSSGSHILATGSWDHTAKLWNIADRRNPTELATIPQDHNVTAIAMAYRYAEFDPSFISSNSLVTGHVQGNPQLYDIRHPSHPLRFEAFTGLEGTITHALTISPDSRKLAIASSDHSIRLANLEIRAAFTTIDEAITTICQRAYPTITATEWNQYFPQLEYQPPCTYQGVHK